MEDIKNIKNIYYECVDCKFICKTKNEMKKHIKTVKCNENNNKLEKKKKKKNEILIIKKNKKENIFYKKLEKN